MLLEPERSPSEHRTSRSTSSPAPRSVGGTWLSSHNPPQHISPPSGLRDRNYRRRSTHSAAITLAMPWHFASDSNRRPWTATRTNCRAAWRNAVAIAGALAGNPSVIVADEPTANLDRELTDHVMGLLRECADAGAAVLLITHDLASLTRSGAADRLAVMYASRIMGDRSGRAGVPRSASRLHPRPSRRLTFQRFDSHAGIATTTHRSPRGVRLSPTTPGVETIRWPDRTRHIG